MELREPDQSASPGACGTNSHFIMRPTLYCLLEKSLQASVSPCVLWNGSTALCLWEHKGFQKWSGHLAPTPCPPPGTHGVHSNVAHTLTACGKHSLEFSLTCQLLPGSGNGLAHHPLPLVLVILAA
jgi:hypothetical protein